MGILLKIIHCYSHLYSWTLKIRYFIFKNEIVGKIHFDCQIIWQLEIDEKKKFMTGSKLSPLIYLLVSYSEF